LAVLSLRPVLRRLLRVGSVWKAGRLSLDKLDMLLTAVPPQDEAVERLLVKQGVIEFQGVRFGYELHQPVVEMLSFRAERGSIFYLNHAAKSTILRLLTKQYEPQAGRILIDKQPISSFSAKAVRKRIAIVSDELPLLGRTVFEAISYSRKPEKRPEAAEMLQQIQTLADLSYPLQLDDRIGENGQSLSKSQRMVLYWVRALLTHKAILLLDEPFEGFSPKGRTQLHQWLQKQVFYKTILVATSELPVTMVQNNARYELSY
jgi:ABC-type multidrug transport system fused ATPase/permease subunit